MVNAFKDGCSPHQTHQSAGDETSRGQTHALTDFVNPTEANCLRNSATKVEFATVYVCKDNELFLTIAGLGNIQTYSGMPIYNGLFSLPNPEWLIRPTINGVSVKKDQCVPYYGFQLDFDPYPAEKFAFEEQNKQMNSYFIKCDNDSQVPWGDGLKPAIISHVRGDSNCGGCHNEVDCLFMGQIGAKKTPENFREELPAWNPGNFHTGEHPKIMETDAMAEFEEYNHKSVEPGKDWRGFRLRPDSLWKAISDNNPGVCDCYTNPSCSHHSEVRNPIVTLKCVGFGSKHKIPSTMRRGRGN